MYHVIYKYYDSFLKQRDHFKVQRAILTDLFHELKIDKSSKVLDASCGTGEVLNSIYKDKFTNVYGNDISSEMLNIAVSKNSNIKFYNHDFLNINAIEQRFDLIFSLGNSFSHVKDFNALKDSLTSIKKALSNKNSYVVIDYRLWDVCGNVLTQKERTKEKILKTLNPIQVNNNSYNIYEEVSEDADRQYVKYSIENIKTQSIEINEVSYLKFSINEFIQCAIKVGFQETITYYKYKGTYPYVITILKNKNT